MTRYIEAFSWTGTIQRFLEEVVTEKPLLNVCSGRTRWGDITLDRYEPANVKGSWTHLPFKKDSHGAAFGDPPWDAGYKKECADFVKEGLRVAPVVYLMAPWGYNSKRANLTKVWYRQLPGVQNDVCIKRYERP